jgi:hypothetical protein
LTITKQYIPPLVCGFSAAVLSTIPGFKELACCLVIPLAAFFSLYLDQKINKIYEVISSRKAITYGLLTGLFAALFATFFDMLMTYATRSNDFVQALPETEAMIKDFNIGPFVEETIKILKTMSSDIRTYGFSGLYLLSMLTSNLITNAIFGLIGGLLGMSYLNKKWNKG